MQRMLRNTIFTLFISFFIHSLSAQTLTVTQALSKSVSSTTVYTVEGYVVGELINYSNNYFIYNMAPPFDGKGSFLIADSPLEYNLQKCLVIQFPNTEVLADYNLDDHSEYWRKQITVTGKIQTYFNTKGLKNISSYEFTKGETWTNEASLWSFYEDMDSKDYVQSGENLFSGGIYTGENGDWKIVGGTYGDTGKDSKYDKASIRLRLTEGTSGEKGSMTMLFDKLNGVGELRFWAGNYEDDKAQQMAFSIDYSLNQGVTWVNAVENCQVIRTSSQLNKGMAQYQFFLNQTGNVRIRIRKSDNTTGGLNIDKLRMSDYAPTTSIGKVTTTDGFNCFPGVGGFYIQAKGALTVHVMNLLGQHTRVVRIKEEKTFIPCEKGVYLIQSKNLTTKVVVK